MPKKEEAEPIADDEWLYRRVYADRFRTNKTPYVSPGAFEPRVKGSEQDVDGISLYRADCLDKADDILALIHDSAKRKINGIVKVLVSEIRSIGLSVNSTPRDEIRGHVSIPELSSTAFSDKNKRPKCKEWVFRLAGFASSDERIVVQPIPMNPRNK
ncbi:MAG: hypothetical protein KF851_17400 [Pirellulaceae bacterium]|nr:hypothetical protein [Pirellulaceae bacterium]